MTVDIQNTSVLYMRTTVLEIGWFMGACLGFWIAYHLLCALYIKSDLVKITTSVDSVAVIILAFQARDPGSTPGPRIFFALVLYLLLFLLWSQAVLKRVGFWNPLVNPLLATYCQGAYQRSYTANAEVGRCLLKGAPY